MFSVFKTHLLYILRNWISLGLSGTNICSSLFGLVVSDLEKSFITLTLGLSSTRGPRPTWSREGLENSTCSQMNVSNGDVIVCTDRQMDRQMNRQTDEQTDRQTDRQTDKQIDIWTDG